MRLAYIINNLLFVVPCILLLLLVFWDQLKTPTLLRIVTGASVFLAGSFLGTYVYFIFESPAQHLVISVVFMFSGVLILDSACRANIISPSPLFQVPYTDSKVSSNDIDQI